MKSAVFYQARTLTVETLPDPEIREDEVLIKVMACGICGTDVHIFEGDEGAAKTPPKTVLGHEFSGIVLRTGKKVQSVHSGDRVTVDPNQFCGLCDACRKGSVHFCTHMTGIGTTVNGGFSELCAVPESQVYKIAATTPFEDAAMTEPVSCCLHGIDLCDIKTDDTVLVIGCGMIGMIMLQLAKLYGAAHVIAIEPDQQKHALAVQLGADFCIDPIHENVEETLAAHQMKHISKVIECVGKPSTMEQAIALAGEKATVMLFGLTAPRDTITIKPFEVFKKELTIKASYINPHTQKRALELIDEKRIDVHSMIYQTAPLDALPEILSHPEKRSKGKYIILPNQR
mgnify:CR=1 FL=1